ncbi:MAG: hypothetical protein ISEC1_P0001 [Thiomicrorhabdus sp.]|nr:MAG: hypothetical protein ISEC1_P0001 [Thiomicrorhabdus sp.]
MITLGGADLYDQEGLAAYAQTRVWTGQYIDKGKGKDTMSSVVLKPVQVL